MWSRDNLSIFFILKLKRCFVNSLHRESVILTNEIWGCGRAWLFWYFLFQDVGIAIGSVVFWKTFHKTTSVPHLGHSSSRDLVKKCLPPFTVGFAKFSARKSLFVHFWRAELVIVVVVVVLANTCFWFYILSKCVLQFSKYWTIIILLQIMLSSYQYCSTTLVVLYIVVIIDQ